MPAISPAAKSHSGHKFGLHPMSFFARIRCSRERGLRRLAFLQCIPQVFLHFARKSAADSTDELQSFAVVQTDQQRAEMFPRTARIGPPADQRIEILVQLDFQPRRTPLFRIDASALLGEDSFQAAPGRQFVKLFTLLRHVIRIPNNWIVTQNLPQQLFSLDQRKPAKIVPI